MKRALLTIGILFVTWCCIAQVTKVLWEPVRSLSELQEGDSVVFAQADGNGGGHEYAVNQQQSTSTFLMDVSYNLEDTKDAEGNITPSLNSRFCVHKLSGVEQSVYKLQFSYYSLFKKAKRYLSIAPSTTTGSSYTPTYTGTYGISQGDYAQDLCLDTLDNVGHFYAAKLSGTTYYYAGYTDYFTARHAGRYTVAYNQHAQKKDLSEYTTQTVMACAWNMYKRHLYYSCHLHFDLLGKATCEYVDTTCFFVTHLPDVTMTDLNYNIIGWWDGHDTLQVGSFYRPIQDITLTAVYREAQTLFSLGTNGVWLDHSSADSIIKGRTIVLPQAVGKEGYHFLGWSSMPNQMGPAAVDIGPAGNEYTISTNGALYAVYEKALAHYQFWIADKDNSLRPGDTVLLVMEHGDGPNECFVMTSSATKSNSYGDISLDRTYPQELNTLSVNHYFRLANPNSAACIGDWYGNYLYNNNGTNRSPITYPSGVTNNEYKQVYTITAIDDDGHYTIQNHFNSNLWYLCYVDPATVYVGGSDFTYVNQHVPPISLSLARMLEQYPMVWSIYRRTRLYDYRVTLLPGEGSGEAQVLEGYQVTLPTKVAQFAPPIQGLTIVGWAHDGDTLPIGATIHPTEDITYTAVYGAPTLLFDVGIHSSNKIPSTTMSPINLPDIIAEEGYRFLGWSLDSNATQPEYEARDSFPSAGTLQENTTLYAVYEQKEWGYHYREVFSPNDIHDGDDIVLVMSDGNPGGTTHLVTYLDPVNSEIVFEDWDIMKQKDEYVFHLRSHPILQDVYYFDYHYNDKIYSFLPNAYYNYVYATEGYCTFKIEDDAYGHFRLGSGTYLCYDIAYTNRLVMVQDGETQRYAISQFDEELSLSEACQVPYSKPASWRIFIAEKTYKSRVLCYTHGPRLEVAGPLAVLPDSSEVYAEDGYRFMYWKAMDNSIYYGGDTISAKEDMSLWAVYLNPGEEWPTPDPVPDWPGDGADGWGYHLFGRCALRGDTAYKYVRTKIDSVVSTDLYFAYGVPQDYVIETIQVVDSPIIGHIVVDSVTQMVTYTPYPGFIGVDGCVLRLMDHHHVEQMIRVDFESCNEYMEDGSEFILSFIRNAYSGEVGGCSGGQYYLRTVAGMPARVEIIDGNGKIIVEDVKAQSYFEAAIAGATGNRAVYVRSSAPIVVETHVFEPYSGDATYHLPLCDLDTSYIIQTAQWTEPTKNMFAVVGTQDNTIVTIHLKGPARGHPKGSTYSITLQKGEVYRAEATDIGYGYSFSGSTVTANHPIAVYQGNPCTLLIPPEGGNGGACDNMYEQTHPVSRAAGKEFVAVGTYSLAESYLEFVTTEPNTTVFMGGKTQFCANAYDTAWCIVEREQPVYVKADKPVVGQYFLCGGELLGDAKLSDPDQYYLHPMNEFHQMTMFTCQRVSGGYFNTTYRHHGLSIIVPEGSENGIYLDGNLLTGFKKVPYGNSLYYLHYRFPGTKEWGVHTIVSRDSGFVASLYGMESAESYSYALPLMHSHLPLIKEHLYDTICIGQTYQWQGRTLTAQGIYTDTVRNEGQIREVHVLELEVADTTSVDTIAIVCNDSLPYLWHGYSLTVDTMVIDTMSTVHGCDSIVRLHMLTHNCGCETYSYLDTTVAYKKLPFRWFGKKYSQPGLYRDTLIGGNVNGCDSIGQLYLLYHIDYEDSIMVCDNEPVTFSTPWGDVDVGLCDDYNGCLVVTEDEDCLVNVHLQVQRIPATSTPRVVNAAICYGEVFDWNGQLLSRDTTIHDTILDFHGCDTIFSTMNLHVHPAPIDYIESEEICIADTLWWHGRKLYHTGIYYDTVLSVITGCDSAYCQMHLHTKLCTMPPPPNPRIECDTAYSTIDTTILCSQIPFEWFGKSYSVSGEYHDTLHNATYTFCDSIGTLYLEVETCECDTSYSSKDTTICAPALPLLWEDSTWTAAGTKTKVLTNAVGCDSIVTLTLYVNQPTTSDTTAVACDSIVWHGVTYTMSGDYDYQTTNAAGCDSTRTLHLTIRHASVGTNDTTVCRNDLPLLWEDSTWTDAGVKTKILTNAAGCDSVVTLTLSVNEPTAGDTAAVACTSFTWYGQTYTSSGSYTRMLANAAGCDSTLTLQLTINQPTNGAKDTTVCAGALPLIWQDSTWTAAGTKTKVLTNAVGCDSIVTLTLYVNQPTTSDTTAVACDSIVWHGITYTMSGDYDYQTTNATGCDSTRTLHLTIRHASVGTNDTTVCRNDLPIVWEDSTWTDAGVKTKILTNAAGCDSVVTLTLSVNEPTAGDTAAVACSSFTWYGQTYTASGSYTHQLTNAAGCDSTLTLQLTINQPTNGAKDTTVCADALPLLWEDSTWTAAGTKTKVLANAVGCDSIVTLTLYVNLPTNSDTTAVACDSIVWHGVTYTMSGDYDYQTTNAAGCDSTRTLHLTIRHASVGTNDTTVCRNDLPLLWEDSIWTDAGVKTKILTNAAGCDSVVTLTLSVNVPTAGDTAAVACTSFTWYRTTYTNSGSYTHMLTNKAGCDSTLTLQLTINQPTTGDTTAYVCAGTDFYWHGAVAQDGAQMTLTNAAGCDSVVTLHLVTLPVYHQDVNLTVCDKQMPYTWNGITCTQAGDYVLDSVTAAGCDSVVTLHLSVDVFSASDTAAAICRADLPYTWHGKQLHDAGTLKDTMVNSVLCDSIITLTLTVNEPTTSDTTATACSSFTWHGTTYTASGDYDYLTTNANGCDSTRTLHLTINQPTTGDTTAYVCAGTDYYWHGTLANDGAQLTLTNAAGCDSVVTLHLITKPVSSYAKDTTVCAEALPIVWADSTWTEAGTKIAILTNASGCDSTITLTLHVNNHCCPDTIHNIAEVNICDTLLPYTWTAAHTLTIDQAGEYSDTLRNDDGCDSILYFLTLTTYTCCAPMEATMQVPDVCADDASMEVTVTMQRGAFNAYRVHYTNAPGNAMPFRDTVINDAPANQSSPVTLTLPVPHDAADRTHYPRPDTYGIAMTLYDACGDSLHLASTTFDVLFPSWLLDQHWDDVIAILNDRYNGGYTFSDIRWLRDGEIIPGERELYIYLPHQLWTTPEEQHHDYAYQALLTRADDGKSILTCPMTPYHIDSTNVLTEPYVAVAPTIVSHENPVVHVMTNTQGTYWIYSLTGKLLRTADYEPCDHEVFDIRLFEAQTMYILVFTPRHETKPLKEKYRAVKVMVE